ncbi:MAG: Cof-type HAD-IIB family hydrolase [Candidatus Cohnella colombiensis]|uniref:Cof-type HAD-IIB family hydrolase n=1 Tax=Candidatus Cohnella colombiensis TaxID=3121368 RepID=A0AA95EYP4_9BACL|nr:MAG: Cof-type HAD-IIB family hydrolase [Cohnella sp.]
MSFRLIALDVDGTLINDQHEVTPRVRDAVRAAAAQGVEIVLCTGRGSTSALPVLAELGLEGTMITHNGASIVDSATKAILAETEIPAALARRYVDFAKARGIHYDMNTAFELYVETMEDHVALMYESMFALPIARSEAEGFPEGMVKMSLFADKESLDQLEEAWGDWQHDLQTVRSGDYFIDVQHPNASKGAALEQLATLRGISRDQILAIGNYYNDVGMLTFAGWGVAMDNSPEDVKALADEVTVSNNEDGVALIIEERVLNRK